jgi:hypothetical protein
MLANTRIGPSRIGRVGSQGVEIRLRLAALHGPVAGAKMVSVLIIYEPEVGM